MHCILAEIDKAIASTEIQAAPGGKSHTITEIQALDENDFMRDIQHALVECNGLNDINHALTDCQVKPIFHTLFLPETFLGSRRSFSQVTAGEVNQ